MLADALRMAMGSELPVRRLEIPDRYTDLQPWLGNLDQLVA